MLSFVVPAHNEELLLPRTLESIRAAAAELDDVHEVIVVDDDSSDATAEIARGFGARVVSVQVRQIAAARNAGARAATGDILVFVDADTTVTPAAVRAAVRVIRDGAVGGGSAVRFDGRLPLWARILQPVATWFARLIGMAPGCFLFCTRSAFVATSGFDESLFAGEEATMSLRLKKVGRIVVVREHVVTSGRKLRAHSGFEIARTLGVLVVLGRRAVRDRRHLDIWYAPRRPDPDAKTDSRA